jgi:hypothetical protein
MQLCGTAVLPGKKGASWWPENALKEKSLSSRAEARYMGAAASALRAGPVLDHQRIVGTAVPGFTATRLPIGPTWTK